MYIKWMIVSLFLYFVQCFYKYILPLLQMPPLPPKTPQPTTPPKNNNWKQTNNPTTTTNKACYIHLHTMFSYKYLVCMSHIDTQRLHTTKVQKINSQLNKCFFFIVIVCATIRNVFAISH